MKLTAALEVEGPRKLSSSDLCQRLGGEESISFSKLIQVLNEIFLSVLMN